MESTAGEVMALEELYNPIPAGKEKRRCQKIAPPKQQIIFIFSPFQTREVTRFPELPYRPFLLFFHREEFREQGSKRL
jgi:hypothetical protein